MIQKVIILPDIHYPKHSKEAISAVFSFIKWFKPTTIVLLGDALEMDSINSWKRGKGSKKFFDGKRLKKEYEGFDRDILTPLEKLCKGATKIYMGGNHEEWANTLIDKEPTLEGMIEPEICLNLKKRGWQWIPYIVSGENGSKRGMIQFGKLILMHGTHWNKYHSAKTAEEFSKSVAYGHVHDVQFYTKTFSDDSYGFHSAQSIGCLCNTSPDFMRGSVNKWINAFGVLYVQPDGHFNLYTPIIVKGRFVYAGKVFK